MDCTWAEGNNGCDGGEEWRVYEWLMKNGGIPLEETYGPYLGQVKIKNRHNKIQILFTSTSFVFAYLDGFGVCGSDIFLITILFFCMEITNLIFSSLLELNLLFKR